MSSIDSRRLDQSFRLLRHRHKHRVPFIHTCVQTSRRANKTDWLGSGVGSVRLALLYFSLLLDFVWERESGKASGGQLLEQGVHSRASLNRACDACIHICTCRRAINSGNASNKNIISSAITLSPNPY